MFCSPEGVSFEANSLRVEVSKAVSNKYATESMLYLTAGLWDLYKNTNIDAETAIVKVILKKLFPSHTQFSLAKSAI